MALLRRGDRGDAVRRLQERLTAAGFVCGPVDGEFGPGTQAAVEALQRAHGLTVDGVVGPATTGALDGAAAPPSPPAGPPPEPAPHPAGAFVPEAVEDPGGGRVSDKSEPAAADRVSVTGYGGKHVVLHRLAAQAWDALVAAARADSIEAPLLELVSGFRSRADQQRLFDQAVERYGSEGEARRWVAKPGGSAHHSGRAVDCWMGSANDSGNVEAQRHTAVYRWLEKHAEDFGWYPYENESWHYEYNPPMAGGQR